MNVIRPIRLVTPIMQRQKGGVIINISTFAAFEPDPLFPTSSVFRAGLAAFTKLFADKYAADNVRMNNVLPGFVDSLPETEDRRQRIPMARYGRSEEIAATIAFGPRREQVTSQGRKSGWTAASHGRCDAPPRYLQADYFSGLSSPPR
jgi:NAD(P)-dependent dehydrogenase (short-subunit alcohol dehydrogenase family)